MSDKDVELVLNLIKEDAVAGAIISHWLQLRGTSQAKAYERQAKNYFSANDYRALKSQIAKPDRELLQQFKPRFSTVGDERFTFIDLFAGIGGFRVAMQSLGGRCVFSSEWNPDAQKTYCHNFGEVPFGDITSPDTKSSIPTGFDVLCAGFPCQAFSVAGYQKGFEDTRGTLFFDVADILAKYRPKAFFLENVKNLKMHDKGRTYEKIHRVLTKDLGYIVKDNIMSPDEYANLPQNRERIFIIGFDPKQISEEKIAGFAFPERKKCTATIADCIDYSIDDPGLFYDERYACSKEIKEQVTRKDTVYQWRRQYVRENKSNRCPTLTANMGAGGHNVPLILTDSGVRKLTPRECLNFQGFPAKYEFGEVATSRRYMQAGNSVAVPLIKLVAQKMVDVAL